MRNIVKELKTIEQEQADQLNKFGGSRTRHNWSDVFSYSVVGTVRDVDLAKV